MATYHLSWVTALNPKHLLRGRLNLNSRLFTTNSQPPLNRLLKISPEVSAALSSNKPVVALESTIYTHGALGNDLCLEEIVRQHGAVPAVCGILAGAPTVGLTPDEIDRMVREGAKKVSRRDLAYLAGRGLLSGPGDSKLHGGTTISGTMVLARLAGIRVFGTGGLGGVHRGGEDSMDISADLTELGRTRVAVVSSGCKGFLDIPRTLEFLETQGALVSTFADGKGEGEAVDFPAFWARESGTKSPFVVRDEREAAAIILAQEQLGVESGLLFANPIPEEHSIPRKDMEAAIEMAVREGEEKGFTGSANTPYVLQRIRELTQGRSVPANKALVRANVARAAKIAVELAKLIDGAPVTPRTVKTTVTTKTTSYVEGAGQTSPAIEARSQVETGANVEESRPVDVLVAGAVALDLNCDYTGGAVSGGGNAVSPALHTSNPASINQSVGGVGHNIALAAHRVSEDGKVRLCSMVGDDIAGSTILSSLHASGLDTSYIRQLGHEYPSTRTAQYVAVNDAHKNLVLAMADMAIFSNHSFPAYWNSAVAASKPRWLVVDANWAEADIQTWIQAGRKHGTKIAFEPVSAAKSQRLFPPLQNTSGGLACVYPHPLVDLCTPNQYELLAMYEAAKRNGHLDTHAWFEVVDAFGIMRGARERFVDITSPAMADAGIPVQSVNLLPYIPTIITKLGANGALLTTILPRDDPRLRDPDEARYVVSRCANDHPRVGGVYMRLFPAVERVKDVVSVNGIGDTFMGVLVAGLAMGGKVERLVNVAQRAAVLTLKSREGVSGEVRGLKGELKRVAEESS
ncbi:Indigoidine synthase A like protein-domain-containing protein [Madurella fahalii]|uniref:Indigoidine synthase A like protein-domain-containing protein n=1 Tax=Madurella fahalii TaxID=1157608 RepID=A0ABQ0FY89_9PEZI